MEAATGRIKVYDSLRGVAVMLVFFSHMTFMQEYYGWFRYLLNGHYEVIFFFVLSGFVMMLNYRDKFQDKLTWKKEKEFIVHRMKKIYLLYLITTLIFFLYGIIGEVFLRGNLDVLQNYIKKLITCIFLLQSLVPSYEVALSFNSVAWFLSALFFLYLLTPILIKVVNKCGGVIMLPVSLLGLCVMWCVTSKFTIYISGNSFLHTTPHICSFYYLIGLSMAHIFLSARMVLKKTFISFLEFLSVFLCVMVALCYQIKIDQLLYRIIMVLSNAFLIFIMAYEKGSLSQWIRKSKVLKWIGEISLEVYLIHYPICMIGFNLVSKFLEGNAVLYSVLFCFFIIVTLLVSWGYHLLVDRQRNKNYI